MPGNPLADAMRRLPTEDAKNTPQPQLCCTLPAPVALSELQQRLLSDIRGCLPERTQEGGRITRIGTSGVLRLLQAVPGSPWRGLSARRLARMLGSCGVHPHAIRFGNEVLRGYLYDELRSAFLVYLPPCDTPGDLLPHCLMRGPSV